MKRVNNFEITGNCVADAKTITCKNGKEKVVFSVAVNYLYTTVGGEQKSVAEYFNVESWHTSIRETVKKGAAVIVRGFRTVNVVNDKTYFSIVAKSVETFVPDPKE